MNTTTFHPYRDIPTDFLAHKFKENKIKTSSFSAKLAVGITVSLASLLMVIYYVGIVRLVTTLWQVVGLALTVVSAVVLLPVAVYRKIRKRRKPLLGKRL